MKLPIHLDLDKVRLMVESLDRLSRAPNLTTEQVTQVLGVAAMLGKAYKATVVRQSKLLGAPSVVGTVEVNEARAYYEVVPAERGSRDSTGFQLEPDLPEGASILAVFIGDTEVSLDALDAGDPKRRNVKGLEELAIEDMGCWLKRRPA